MTDYITLDEFSNYLFPIGNAGVNEDPQFTAAITAASRAVDVYCARRFFPDTNASARYYQPTDPYCLTVDDFYTTTGLIVAVDTDDNGTYDLTWTVTTDYWAGPLNSERNGITGLPYTEIVATRTRAFPTSGIRHRVSITAKWGWTAVPDPVKQATKIKAASIYRRSKTPDGIAGGGDFGAIRVSNREDPDVCMLLGPYRKVGGRGLVIG